MPFVFGEHALIDSPMFEALTGLDPDSLTAQEKVKVQMQVNAASTQITRHIGIEIKQATYQEVWDGQENDTIITGQYPILSVSSIKLACTGEFSNVPALDQSTYSIDPQKIAIYLRSGLLTPRARSSVEVIYSAGFSVVPDDIQYACFLQYSYLSSNGGGMLGLSTISKMNESQTKDGMIKKGGLISEVVGILESYRRMDAPSSVMLARVS